MWHPAGPGAVILALVVLALVIRSLGSVVRISTQISFTDLRAVSKELHERIGGYLESNFSGDAAQLPAVMRGLIPVAREVCARRGQQISDSTLRLLVVSSVASHRSATRAQAEAAYDQAIAEERAAA
jgi:hypothetical protein